MRLSKKQLLVVVPLAAAAACLWIGHAKARRARPVHAAGPRAAGPQAGATVNVLPGMPPVLDPNNLYSAAGANMLSPVVRNFPPRVYVPNSKSDTVDIIDPATYKIIGHFALPRNPRDRYRLLEPQHVIPSWDLKKLWVAQDLGDQLTEIDPATGKEGITVHVD
ncbi:MAG: YncE family protein, partial [Bryobacteraceae bacterium]